MTIVVDASTAIRWLFKLDLSDRAEALLASGERLIAPDLVLAEIASAIWKFVRFEGVSADSATAVLSDADQHFDELVPANGLKDRALALAIELGHPVYDCFYLALAQQRAGVVVTTDRRLVRRCADTPFASLVRLL
jgi:predicted nucleic acid-binding protein